MKVKITRMIGGKLSACLLVLLALSFSAVGQLQPKAVQAKTISKLAAKAKLYTAMTAHAVQAEKMVKLTPVNFPENYQLAQLEKGQVIGVIETTKINGIQDGKHNIFVHKVGDQWEALFESGGKITARSTNVRVADNPDGQTHKPQIEFNLTFSVYICGHHIITIKIEP